VKVKEGDLTIPEFYDTVLPLHQVVEIVPSRESMDEKILLNAFETLERQFDPSYGGFGGARQQAADQAARRHARVDGQAVRRDHRDANARKESYEGAGGKGKGYKPTDVSPANIREDVLRREFTFNTLHNANKQIVVTSDRPPNSTR
jgi:hypothetical protein